LIFEINENNVYSKEDKNDIKQNETNIQDIINNSNSIEHADIMKRVTMNFPML
jgi:hypothetical protein